MGIRKQDHDGLYTWTKAFLLWAALLAGFSLLEDFDSLSLGDINNQGNWRASSGSGFVVADPCNPANQVLAVTTNSAVLHRPAWIANGDIRMVYLRFQFAGQQNYSFGFSDFVSPDQFGEFCPELGMSNAGNELRINDGGTYTVLALLTPNVWYDCWILLDNAADATQVWVHDRSPQAASWADQLANIDDPDDKVFDFRSAAGNLVTFFIKTGGGGSGNSGPLYLDDIYVEETSTLNLLHPLILPGDTEPDGDVDMLDLCTLASAWLTGPGQSGWNPICDWRQPPDEFIDLHDFAAFAVAWIAE